MSPSNDCGKMQLREFARREMAGVMFSASTSMPIDKQNIKRKLIHAGGWQVAKRAAKMLPFGGTAIAIALVGTDIRKKGVVKGIVNSGLDAIPVVGLAKNAVELFTGDFIADKERKK